MKEYDHLFSSLHKRGGIIKEDNFQIAQLLPYSKYSKLLLCVKIKTPGAEYIFQESSLEINPFLVQNQPVPPGKIPSGFFD